MQGLEKAKVLFIAGFGPIVRDVAAGRKLYAGTLAIPFKEEAGGYLHTDALQGAKSFALWPLSQAAQSCFGHESWPPACRYRRHGWNLMWTTSQLRRQNLRHRGIACSSAIRRNHGAKPSVDLSTRTGCW